MTNNIEVLRGLDELVEAARLLGTTQAKKGFGCYTAEDSRFERAMHKSIAKHRAALAAMGGQGEACELLRGMGLDPERFRTEGGRLNPAKVRAAIRHPESYAGLYLPREHDFGHSAKFGGGICFLCGAVKGTPRAGQPCVAHPAPQQPEAQAVPVARKPDGYAYRYPSTTGEGTVIRFTCGQDINGSRAIEAVPYFYGTPPAKVPEVVVSRQIITPVCRANRGDWGAFSEAFDRVRKAYLHYVEAPQNANVDWHVTLTRVETAAAPAPKEG